MHSKKFKQAFSITLISALIVSSAISAFAANVDGAGKGKPDHVIEKQQEKQEKVEIKREDRLEKQEERIEKQNQKREEILQKREVVKAQYTEEELEVLNENTENLKNIVNNGKVLPFDSIVSNRKNIKFDTPPVIKGSRTLVPLRAISEGFKADVEWNGETREVTITKGDMEIVIKIDSNIISVNGEEMEIDAKAEIMSNRTYVPLRFIAETLGIKVDWDQETETIELKEDLEVLKDELQEELDELQVLVEELEKKLDDLRAQLENLDSELQEDIEALKELEEEFANKLEELEAKVKEIEANLQEVMDEIELSAQESEEQEVEESQEVEEAEEVEELEDQDTEAGEQ